MKPVQGYYLIISSIRHHQANMSLIYPTDPTQLPKELAGVQWPPKS